MSKHTPGQLIANVGWTSAHTLSGSMSKHTPGPWSVCTNPPNDSWHEGKTIYSVPTNTRIADVFSFAFNSNESVTANARRIVACVNALEGASTEMLEQAVSAGITDVSMGNLFSSRMKLQQQITELVDVLLKFPGFTDDAIIGDAWIEMRNAAIAKVTGDAK